jgi:GntR family transcriptional regulator
MSALPAALGSAAPPDGAVPAFTPLYRQIKSLLTRSLQEGEWRPGETIPSEHELAARYKVSQGTVRKAVDELATENLLVRRQGRGTFVATHAEARTRFRFLRLTPDDGTPPGLQRRLIECRRQRAGAETARLLALRSGDAVVEIRRVLSDAAGPVVLEEIVLPGGPFRGLTAERLSAYAGPMYRFFEAEFGLQMIRAEEKIRAVSADAGQAQWLDVPAGAPLLMVERIAHTYDDRPIELRRGWYRTDRHHYRNELI